MVLGVKNPPATVGDARDAGSIPGLDRSPGEGNGNSPQDSFFFFNLFICFSGCAWSVLLHRLFSSCGELGLPSRCGARVSHCGGFSFARAQGVRAIVAAPRL